MAAVLFSPARAFILRRRLGIDPALGGRGQIAPAARVGGVGDFRDGRRFRGTNTPRPKSNSLRRLRLVDRSAHWSVYAQVKKVTIQAHGKYAKLGGRADLLVAMVKDRFRKVGEAIGVELELKSPEE